MGKAVPGKEDLYLVVVTPIFAGLDILEHAIVIWNKTTRILTG
jgi:hypothetical protein